MLQVSQYEGAEKAAQVVKYFNKDNNLRVHYWAIGNEPYIIHHMPILEISNYLKEIAQAMKAVDPSIKIFAPDEAAYDANLYKALLMNDRTSVAGRDKNGNWYIDGVTFHNYPNAKDYSRSDVIFFSESKMREMMMNLKKDIDVANEKYQRFGEDALVWGLTEFNITYKNPDDLSATGVAVPSFINGQFWANIFGMAMEYGAFTVTPWCIQESDRAETYFGYIGGPPNFTPHSTFYHMQLIANHFSGNYIKLITNNPYVKAFASNDKGITSILMMNQSEDQVVTFDFERINKEANSNELAIKSETSFNVKHKGKIGPNCTHVFQFNAKGELIKKMEYTLEMAMNNQAPAELK